MNGIDVRRGLFDHISTSVNFYASISAAMSAATSSVQPAAGSAMVAQPAGGRPGVVSKNSSNARRGSIDVDIDAVIREATSRAQSVAPAVRSPTGRDTRTQLFVGNLPYRVRWQDLKDLFRKAGTVLRADVSLGSDNRSRGYGTVLLATAEDAGRAIDMFNGYSWQSRTLEVRPDRLPPDATAEPGAIVPSSTSIPSPLHAMQYVPPALGPGLAQPPWLNLDPLARPQSNGPNGVTYADHLERPASSMDASLVSLRRGSSASRHDITESLFERKGSTSPGVGVSISVQSNSPFLYPVGDLPDVGSNVGPRPGPSGHGPRSLFVGNLPFHIQWQDLKDHFRPAGHIVRADIVLGPDGRSRGYGTVLFAHEVDALKAVDMFNGKEFNGRPLKVHFDKYSQAVPTNGHGGSMISSPHGHPSLSHPPAMTKSNSQNLPLSYSNNSISSSNLSHESYQSSPHSIPQSISQASMTSVGDYPWPLQQPPLFIDHLGSPVLSDPGTPHKVPLSPGSPLMMSNGMNGMPRQNNGHPHPGPISLPPAFNPLLGSPMSPMMSHGLPPMTPSMPGFSFHPQVQTPPLHPHFLSPGIGPFSPPLHGSPFFHNVNTNWNAAPGAPVHVPHSPGSPPPLQGYNPNYPPFTMPSFVQNPASEENPAYYENRIDLREEAHRQTQMYAFPALAESSSRRESYSGESLKSSDPGLMTDAGTEESTAPPSATAAPGRTLSDVRRDQGPNGLMGLGLSDVMEKLNLSAPHERTPTDLSSAVSQHQASPIKRAQSTTPSTQNMQTPTPPSSSFPTLNGPLPTDEPVNFGGSRFSLDGLVAPATKADRRASWAVGSRRGGGHL